MQPSWHEAVASSVHGQEMHRRPWFAFDLAAQAQHERVDGARRRKCLEAPDLVEQALASDDLARMREKQSDQIELQRCERLSLTCARHRVLFEVDDRIAD